MMTEAGKRKFRVPEHLRTMLPAVTDPAGRTVTDRTELTEITETDLAGTIGSPREEVRNLLPVPSDICLPIRRKNNPVRFVTFMSC